MMNKKNSRKLKKNIFIFGNFWIKNRSNMRNMHFHLHTVTESSAFLRKSIMKPH